MAVSYKVQYPFDCLGEDWVQRETREPPGTGLSGASHDIVHLSWWDFSDSNRADRGDTQVRNLLPVAEICIGGVEEYCPYKDWSTQMPPSSFQKKKKPLNANFSTLCLAECVCVCVWFFFFSLSDLKSVVVIGLLLKRHVGRGKGSVVMTNPC